MSDEENATDDNVAVKVLQTVTPRAIRKSFAIKFGLVLAVMAVSIAGIGLAATSTITDQTQDQTEQQFQSSAEQQANVVEQWVSRNRENTVIYSNRGDWSHSSAANLGTELSQIRTENDETVSNLHLVDIKPNGDVVVNSSTSLQPGEPITGNSDRSYISSSTDELNRSDTRGAFVSDTYVIHGTEVVGFLSKTSSGIDGTRFLLVEARLSTLRNDIITSDNATETVVVNQNSYSIMASPSPEDTLSPYGSGSGAREPIDSAADLRDSDLNQSGVIAEMPADPDVIDESYTVGYAPVEDTEWVVAVQAPHSSVFGFVQTINTWGLIATAFAVLLIGVTGAVLGYSTSTAIDRLTGKTEEMREGNLDVSFNTSRVDNIGRLYGGFAEMRDSLKEQIAEAEKARKEAEVSRAEALELSNYLQEKAEEYSVIMQQCAAGDLTQRMTQHGENESIDTIAAEFNEMIEELEKTTGQLKSYVDEVEEAGAEVEQSANTVREASEQVADSIQKIAIDAENQKERLQSISETMDEIADELDTFADKHPEADIDAQLDRIQDIANNINEIADLSEETQAETDNVSAAAQEQAAELNEVSERANDLQRYAQPLRDILDRFDTEAEHEFVFSVGPTGGGHSEGDAGAGDSQL
jgi:methyl-accepting chemotaxis protein